MGKQASVWHMVLFFVVLGFTFPLLFVRGERKERRGGEEREALEVSLFPGYLRFC